jgi:hypothetical protein
MPTTTLDRLVAELKYAREHRCRPSLNIGDIEATNILAELEQVMSWKEAVIDACVINHMSWDENDARNSLAELICYETAIALDPRVSLPAITLMEVGAKRAADIIHQAAMAAADHNDLRGYSLLIGLRDAISNIDHTKDDCQVCGGRRGGVPGNENVVDGKLVCDYCEASRIKGENG